MAALRSLRLENEPPLVTKDADGNSMPTDTRLVKLWAYAFRQALGLPVEQVDVPRIRRAFADCLGCLTKWPQPKTVIDLMPRRPHRHQLPAPLTADDRQRGKEFFRQMAQRVG